ncbi:inactive pancreatic lipase-related protein 1-like [Calliphora vicina]|uniref:inactive pancreatic lipase-related protein 1-like n=1 Tax=Calliphora vicina TaxID=7373 RepID=UPI00325AB271
MISPVSWILYGLYIVLLAGNCISCAINKKTDIKFMLYTSQNPSEYEYLYVGDKNGLQQSNFNFTNPLVIYVHGFNELAIAEKQSSQKIKDAFLQSGDYNVLLIDWSKLAAAPWYLSAVGNLPTIGKYVARFIRFLMQQSYEVEKIHLIGFSLGAEIAGNIGRQLQKWNITLPRITGLDPPWPLFHEGSRHRCLSYKVAEFVDVIHTDDCILGNPKAMGHADFYPNGGHALQPGCVRRKKFPGGLLKIMSCSHQRAWKYFIESIQRLFAFKARRCKPSKSFSTCSFDDNGEAFMGMTADKR